MSEGIDRSDDALPPLPPIEAAARPISSANAKLLVLRALDHALGPANPRTASKPSVREAAPRTLSAAAVILLAVGIAGAASAAVYIVTSHSDRGTDDTTPSRTRTRRPTAVTPAPNVVALPEIHVAPVPNTAQARARTNTTVQARESEGVTRDALLEASRLRASGQWRAAERAYLSAARGRVDERTAYVALVAAAGLRLDHLHNPSGALALYRSALRLRPTGQLDEEILLGGARAYRALGDRAQEARSLREVIARFPRGASTAFAERRLASLSE